MRSFVVDASVVVKWLVDEPHSDKAAKLLENGLLLAAPELIYAEAIARQSEWEAGDKEDGTLVSRLFG